jgi:hypothetical protein
MYIFAKFVADHVFLQNRDKLNIKKFVETTAFDLFRPNPRDGVSSPESPSLLLAEKVYITPSSMRGRLHNPQPMKQFVSPPELSKTCQITP